MNVIEKIFTIDSSVFISSFLEAEVDFENSRKCLENFLNLNGVRFVMPTLVYLEIVTVLKKLNLKKSDLLKVENLFAMPVFNWIPVDMGIMQFSL